MATQKEIADYLGIDERTIRNWSKRPGFPVSKGRGGLSQQAVVKWLADCYIKQNQIKIDPAFEPVEDEEKELELAEKRAKLEDRLLIIEKRKFDLSVLRQQFAPITVLTRTLERVAVSLSTNLESMLPHIKRAWPDMPIESVDVIKKIIAQCRNEVAEIEPDLSDFNPSDFDGSEDGA